MKTDSHGSVEKQNLLPIDGNDEMNYSQIFPKVPKYQVIKKTFYDPYSKSVDIYHIYTRDNWYIIHNSLMKYKFYINMIHFNGDFAKKNICRQ